MMLKCNVVLILLMTCLFIFFACKKEKMMDCPDGLVAGRIIGIDARKCACCSGWWIEMEKDTLRSFILPDDIQIEDANFSEGIDIPVCLSYQKSTDCADWNELIEIKEMILQ